MSITMPKQSLVGYVTYGNGVILTQGGLKDTFSFVFLIFVIHGFEFVPTGEMNDIHSNKCLHKPNI